MPPDIERLALLGWRLYPASQFSRAACIKNFTTLATHDLGQLERWSHEFPNCNWGIVMAGSGAWALDVDVPGPDHDADGVKALADLTAKHGPLPLSPMTRSGGGGLVLFFRDNGAPISGRSGTPAPGLDPRRGRLPLIVPPSIHHRSRRPYRWIVPPWELSPPAAPEWLMRLVAPPPVRVMPDNPPRLPDAPEGRRRYAVAALRHASGRVAGAPQGTRNDTLNAEIFALMKFQAEGVLHESEIANAMAYAGGQAGLLPPEVKATLASALKAGGCR